MSKQVTPYQSEENKKNQVRSMFNNIAGKYDFLNRLLSLGIDKGWRKKAISLIKQKEKPQILDVATGTGDLAIELLRKHPNAKVIGLDLAVKMLEIGREKASRQKLGDQLEFMEGDAEHLPFDDNTFDSITVAFGVRNFESPEAGLKEMRRVLKPEGQLIILEFSKSKFPLFNQLFNLYFKYILPQIGRLISKDGKAYKYLYDSVQAFPSGNEFVELMNRSGYQNGQHIPLTLGVCSIYYGEK